MLNKIFYKNDNSVSDMEVEGGLCSPYWSCSSRTVLVSWGFWILLLPSSLKLKQEVF